MALSISYPPERLTVLCWNRHGRLRMVYLGLRDVSYGARSQGRFDTASPSSSSVKVPLTCQDPSTWEVSEMRRWLQAVSTGTAHLYMAANHVSFRGGLCLAVALRGSSYLSGFRRICVHRDNEPMHPGGRASDREYSMLLADSHRAKGGCHSVGRRVSALGHQPSGCSEDWKHSPRMNYSSLLAW